MVTGHFGPARGIMTWVVSAWVMKGPVLHFSLIFSQNLTPAHLSFHTHIIMHTHIIITFKLWPKQPKTEMTHSENWPKWTTDQVQNDPPPKFGWNNPRQINPVPQWPAFRSISQFNSQQVPINEALSKFHWTSFLSYNFCLLRLEFMHTLESRPTSFFHSFEIRIIECEHNRNHMITSCVFFFSFLGLFCFNLYFRCHFVWIFAKLCFINCRITLY